MTVILYYTPWAAFGPPQIVEKVSILVCHCEERSDVAIRIPKTCGFIRTSV